jgi:hypothetical protein
MLPLFVAWTTTSILGSPAPIFSATSPLSSGDASSMIRTRTSTPG